MRINSSIAIASSLLFAAVALHAAQAQTKPAKTVTRDELRVCMNSESDLKTRREALEALKSRNNDEAAAIKAEAEQMAEDQKKVGQDENRMEKFNRRVKAHNERVKAANANVASFRTEAETLNAGLVAYNDQCGGITFHKEDKDAILKEREAAKK
jgi:uncharacterized protein (DUF3084 family)